MTEPINQGQDQQSGAIIGKDGNPYSSKQNATQALASRGLDVDVYTVAEVEGGWAIVLRGGATKPAPERVPKPQVDTTGTLGAAAVLDEDPPTNVPAEEIVRPTAPEMPKMNFIDPLTVKGERDEEGNEKPERYYWVTFDPKSNANDPERVTLGVNGEMLTIAREIQVILPARFVEAAEHAVEQKFIQKPGEERKSLGKARTFPFRLLGEATKDEYLRMKAIGDAQVRDSLEKSA